MGKDDREKEEWTDGESEGKRRGIMRGRRRRGGEERRRGEWAGQISPSERSPRGSLHVFVCARACAGTRVFDCVCVCVAGWPLQVSSGESQNTV